MWCCLAAAVSSILHVRLHYKRPLLLVFVSNCQSCQGLSQNIHSNNWSPLWNIWIMHTHSFQQIISISRGAKSDATKNKTMHADSKNTVHIKSFFALWFLLFLNISSNSFCWASNLSSVYFRCFLNFIIRSGVPSISADILLAGSCHVLVSIYLVLFDNWIYSTLINIK